MSDIKLASKEFKEYMIEHYVNGDKSVPDIALVFDTYPNAIYRAMRKCGVPRRTRSEAQQKVLATGKSKHPTKGMPLTPQAKQKIGRAVYQHNLNISDAERERRLKRKQEIWANIPEDVRQEYLKRSHKSVRRSAKEGSKFEEFIVSGLLAEKYKVQVHHKLDFADSQLNVDLYLPVEGVAIEIDGPCHFEPIFGQEALDDQIERDLRKNSLLIGDGYSLIRIQNMRGHSSMSFFEDFMKKFMPFLKEVCKAEENKLYSINVEDSEFTI